MLNDLLGNQRSVQNYEEALFRFEKQLNSEIEGNRQVLVTVSSLV
jgi:hypothetical protein